MARGGGGVMREDGGGRARHCARNPGNSWYSSNTNTVGSNTRNAMSVCVSVYTELTLTFGLLCNLTASCTRQYSDGQRKHTQSEYT
eukprot:860933-Rhodomonas_salina.1